MEVGRLALCAVVDAITRDADGRARFHFTIVDYGALWAAGEARAGDDAAAVAWATDLAPYALTPEAAEVIGKARAALLPAAGA